jgi:hypothetical protein
VIAFFLGEQQDRRFSISCGGASSYIPFVGAFYGRGGFVDRGRINDYYEYHPGKKFVVHESLAGLEV